jgi:hypothetical protein
VAGPDSAGASVKALWVRAPIWRLFLMTAALLTLLFALFPPRKSMVTTPPAPVAYTGTATYTSNGARQIVGAALPKPPTDTAAAAPMPGALLPAKSKTLGKAPQTAAATTPKTAVLAMVTGNPGGAENESGLSEALIGRLYRGSVRIDGFTVPLPPGDWANLANSTIKQASATGDAHFLGHIRGKRLVGAVRIFAMRSNDRPGEGFDEVKSCTEMNPGRTFATIDDEMTPHGHQACWTIRSVYATPWSQWADHAVKISFLDRAAAGDMTAKGVTYPQDFVSLTFTRTEKWGLLEVMYLFSPEAEGISSNPALAVSESDWTPANIGQYPQKVAYVDKLKAWGVAFWPQFKAAFDQADHAKD